MNAANVIVGASALVILLGWLALRHARPDDSSGRSFLIVVGGWLTLFAAASQLDLIRRSDLVPPPALFLFVSMIAGGIALGRSGWALAIARAIPIRWLVSFHAFRFLAELSLYLAYREGIGPVQMTLLGNNLDVTTAVAAVLLGCLPERLQRPWQFHAFNVLGLGNLGVIAVTAALSMPSPFRYYLEEPSQIWVSYMPYIYLPAVLVTAAFAGHVVVWRAVRLKLGAHQPQAMARAS